MPRQSNRGGRRTGTPGATYPNRTDLHATQPVTTAPNQTYGEAGQQAAAQKAVPLPNTPAPGAAPAVGAVAAPAGPAPGSLGPLTGPTNNPAEPLTSGIASGPGPGPEALGVAPDPTVGLLKGIMQRFPNRDIQNLLNQAQSGNG